VQGVVIGDTRVGHLRPAVGRHAAAREHADLISHTDLTVSEGSLWFVTTSGAAGSVVMLRSCWAVLPEESRAST
jgi:hypothetical protein